MTEKLQFATHLGHLQATLNKLLTWPTVYLGQLSLQSSVSSSLLAVGECLVWLIGVMACLVRRTTGPGVCYSGQWMAALCTAVSAVLFSTSKHLPGALPSL